MSIATKTGDNGTTALMYGRRVAKTHPRIEACGAVDELNAAIGLARASAAGASTNEALLAVQKNLVLLMGELATSTDDLERYFGDGYRPVTSVMTSKLDHLIQEIEAQSVSFKGWATPGANPHAAALDLSRTVCRRAERRVCELKDSGDLRNPEILIYLNRLADALWLLARLAESKQPRPE